MSFTTIFNKKSSNFATILHYKNKNGDIANYNIVYNFSYKTLLNKSIKLLSKYKTTDYDEILAKHNILQNLKNRLKNKTKSLKCLVENGQQVSAIKVKDKDLYIEGLIINKKPIKCHTKQQTYKSKYDAAIHKINDMLPISKYRLFKLKDLDSIKLDKLTINIHI